MLSHVMSNGQRVLTEDGKLELARRVENGLDTEAIVLYFLDHESRRYDEKIMELEEEVEIAEEDGYERGFVDGKEEGFEEGYEDGYKEGKQAMKEEEERE